MADLPARPVVAADPTLVPVDWKLAAIRLIEAVAWPVAFVIVALIFRTPLTAILTALAHKLGA